MGVIPSLFVFLPRKSDGRSPCSLDRSASVRLSKLQHAAIGLGYCRRSARTHA
jgi:hypothetical protein